MANKTLPQLYVDNPITVPAATALIELSQGGVSGAVQVQNLAPLRAVHTFTQAELLHLVGTPITLIAAPGAGYLILPIGVRYLQDTVAGAYTYTWGATGVILAFLFGASELSGSLSADLSTAVKHAVQFVNFGSDVVDLTHENLALKVSLGDNDTGNLPGGELTGGNVASKVYVVVHYYIVPTSVP